MAEKDKATVGNVKTARPADTVMKPAVFTARDLTRSPDRDMERDLRTARKSLGRNLIGGRR